MIGNSFRQISQAVQKTTICMAITTIGIKRRKSGLDSRLRGRGRLASFAENLL